MRWPRCRCRLAASEHFGLYHGTAGGETTWADFARFMAEAAGVAGARVEGVAASSLRLRAARPRRAVLVSRRLAAAGVDPLPSWQDQAQAYLASEGVATAPTGTP